MSQDYESMARNLLLLTNIFNFIKIQRLVVPELVEATSSDVILDCQYTVPDENFTLQWTLNNMPIYEWSPHSIPKVKGILNGRLDLTYRASNKSSQEHRALRIIHLTPEMSGNYSCIVESHNVTARQTKLMIIYSYEHEFDLVTEFNNDTDIVVYCIARGVYPRPDLTLEYNGTMVSGQWQRIWRSDQPDNGWLYDAMCHAEIKAQSVSDKAVVVCRLNLPDADYTAIKKKIILPDGSSQASSASNWKCGATFYALFVSILFNI